MVVARNKITQMYIATKRLRNENIQFVHTTEDAQKFPSMKQAREQLTLWGIDYTEYELNTCYYASQMGFSKSSFKAPF